MPETAAPVEPKPAPIFPGDIVQVTAEAHAYYRALVLVEAVMPWGYGCKVVFVFKGRASEIYIRVRRDEGEKVGTARLVPGEIATARREAMAAARDDN